MPEDMQRELLVARKPRQRLVTGWLCSIRHQWPAADGLEEAQRSTLTESMYCISTQLTGLLCAWHMQSVANRNCNRAMVDFKQLHCKLPYASMAWQAQSSLEQRTAGLALTPAAGGPWPTW